MTRKTEQQISVPDVSSMFADMRDSWRSTHGLPTALYRAAKTDRWSLRLSGSSSGSSADQHYASERDYFYMVEMARQLDRDDLVAGAAVTRLCSNILQGGFTYDPQTGNARVDEILRERWKAYAQNTGEVELQGEQGLNALAASMLRASIVDGDAFVLLTNRGKLQAIENHRCRTPSNLAAERKRLTIHGVELDRDRRRVGYWFSEDDIRLNESPRFNEMRFIEAYDGSGSRNVLHLYHPKRVTQTRGVTKFAPCTAAVRMHDDIQFAKLVQQQGVSVWSLIRERDLGFELPDNVSQSYHRVADPCSPGETRPIQNISAGMWYTGLPGERIKGFSPNVPSPTFFDHAKQIQMLIAINLDLPLILMLMDASETNFSGWRGALEQAKIKFREFQQWFCDSFYRQVFAWKMRQWSTPGSPFADPMLVRMRSRGVNVFAHDWIFPSWPYIEPLKEASADLLEMRNGLTSPRRIQGRRGRDWSAVSTEMVEDTSLLIRKAKAEAKRINDEFPDDMHPVTWRDLASLPTPDGLQISATQDPPQESQVTSEQTNADETEAE